MIVDEKHSYKIKDLLSACMEQPDKIHRIIVEVEADFERSKLKALLKSNRWPLAVNPHLIVSPKHEDKLERGESLLDTFVENGLIGKRFLDFGCGEGHVAKVASDRAEFAVGYDIDETGWEVFHETERFMLTNDWQAVVNKGPYDVIFVYDVLDHIVDEDPIELLQDARSVLAPGGKVFIRCHPWCSRTGSHNYRTLNKAWIHLFFSEEELREMGCDPLPVKKILHPMLTYEDWFSKSGFKTVSENTCRQSVEPFFEQEELLCKIIKDHWKDSIEERLRSGKVFPRFQLEQNTLDFILEGE